jgi:hypothetical protein
MNLEQFTFKKSQLVGFDEEAKVVTNGSDKNFVQIFTTPTTWTIRKFQNGRFKYETIIQKNQRNLLDQTLKNISKR